MIYQHLHQVMSQGLIHCQSLNSLPPVERFSLFPAKRKVQNVFMINIDLRLLVMLNQVYAQETTEISSKMLPTYA